MGPKQGKGRLVLKDWAGWKLLATQHPSVSTSLSLISHLGITLIGRMDATASSELADQSHNFQVQS